MVDMDHNEDKKIDLQEFINHFIDDEEDKKHPHLGLDDDDLYAEGKLDELPERFKDSDGHSERVEKVDGKQDL